MPENLYFFKHLADCDKSEHLHKLIAYVVTPVLKGLKPSELVVLNADRFLDLWTKEKPKILATLKLCCREMRQSEENIHLLFYDPTLLRQTLCNEDCCRILSAHGYPKQSSVNNLLGMLSKRLSYKKFPHEIGLFLGYPPGDVQGFIDCQGKNFHLCRYWKVYANKEECLCKFQQLDAAKKEAAETLSRMPADHAIHLLKAI